MAVYVQNHALCAFRTRYGGQRTLADTVLLFRAVRFFDVLNAVAKWQTGVCAGGEGGRRGR